MSLKKKLVPNQEEASRKCIGKKSRKKHLDEVFGFFRGKSSDSNLPEGDLLPLDKFPIKPEPEQEEIVLVKMSTIIILAGNDNEIVLFIGTSVEESD